MKQQAAAVLIISWFGSVTSSWGGERINVQLPGSPSAEVEKGDNTMSNDDTTTARSLKDTLRSTFDRLKSTGSLSGKISGTDITEVVQKYINVDTPFADAEQILKDAGFEINYPDLVNGPNDVNRAVDWYAVVARIYS